MGTDYRFMLQLKPCSLQRHPAVCKKPGEESKEQHRGEQKGTLGTENKTLKPVR